MAGNGPSKTQQAASDEARLQIMKMKMELQQAHENGLLVPDGWEVIDTEPPAQPKRRVTVRLDADMLDWFRGMGPGYQTRMNRVLRLFMLHSISGELEGKWERGWDGALRKVG